MITLRTPSESDRTCVSTVSSLSSIVTPLKSMSVPLRSPFSTRPASLSPVAEHKSLPPSGSRLMSQPTFTHNVMLSLFAPSCKSLDTISDRSLVRLKPLTGNLGVKPSGTPAWQLSHPRNAWLSPLPFTTTCDPQTWHLEILQPDCNAPPPATHRSSTGTANCSVGCRLLSLANCSVGCRLLSLAVRLATCHRHSTSAVFVSPPALSR